MGKKHERQSSRAPVMPGQESATIPGDSRVVL